MSTAVQHSPPAAIHTVAASLAKCHREILFCAAGNAEAATIRRGRRVEEQGDIIPRSALSAIQQLVVEVSTNENSSVVPAFEISFSTRDLVQTGRSTIEKLAWFCLRSDRGQWVGMLIDPLGPIGKSHRRLLRRHLKMLEKLDDKRRLP